MRGFHQVSKSEKTFETTFGNLMKPEARVFEITSPTKKISRNYNFNKFSEFKHISYLRRGMSRPVTYLVLPGVLHWHSMPRQFYLATRICDSHKQTRCFAIQVAG